MRKRQFEEADINAWAQVETENVRAKLLCFFSEFKPRQEFFGSSSPSSSSSFSSKSSEDHNSGEKHVSSRSLIDKLRH
jgi:hypothetical protein